MEKWDPLKDIFTLRERINKLFEDVPVKNGDAEAVVWVPSVDIYELPGEFVVKADLPEVAEADVNITMEDNVLKISGQRKLLKEGRNYYQVERFFGPFSRSFVLSSIVDKDNIKATLIDGVLKIRLPKRQKNIDELPRQIEIK